MAQKPNFIPRRIISSHLRWRGLSFFFCLCRFGIYVLLSFDDQQTLFSCLLIINKVDALLIEQPASLFVVSSFCLLSFCLFVFCLLSFCLLSLLFIIHLSSLKVFLVQAESCLVHSKQNVGLEWSGWSSLHWSSDQESTQCNMNSKKKFL